METPGSSPNGIRENIRAIFATLDPPARPVTTAEVVGELECARSTARQRLDELAELGELRSRELPDGTRVWWRSETSGRELDQRSEGAELGQQSEEVELGQQSEGAEFSAFVNAVEDYAIFVLDPSGEVASWNEGAQRIKGYTEDEILGEHFSTFYTAGAVETGVPEDNLETAATAGRVEDEGWRVREDGSRFWANVTITAIRGDDGTLRGFTKVTRDMTERREYEQQLRRERDLTEQILETVPVSIGLLTPDGGFVRANQRMLDRFGLDDGALAVDSVDSWSRGRYAGSGPGPDSNPGSNSDLELDFDSDSVPDPNPDSTSRSRPGSGSGTGSRPKTGSGVDPGLDSDPDSSSNSDTDSDSSPNWNVNWDLYDADGEPIPTDEWPWSRVVETGSSVHSFECQAELPDDGRRWLSIDAAPIRNADGQQAGDRIVVSIDDITERKERERELRREHEQTEKLVQTAPISIAVHDAAGETVMANRRAQETLGLSEAKLVAEPQDADWTVYDADGERLAPDETPSARVLASEEPIYNEELRIELPDGDRIEFRMNAVPLFGPDGEIERVVTAGEEITALKQRERQLERRKTELETELSEVLDRISDAFYALDDEWRFTHLNESAAEILQRTEDELLGRTVWEVFPEAKTGIYDEKFRRAMDTQEPVSFEVYTEWSDSWLEFNVYPSESGLSIYFHDVTDRKAREQELERYETLFTESTDVNAVLNPNGTFQYLPPSVENVLGYDPDELVGEDTFDRVHPEDRDRVVADFQRMVENPEYSPTNEFRYEHADGSWVWLESTGRNLLTEPHIEGLVAYTRDVTERLERERALERTERRFEAIFEDPNILVGLLEPDGTVLDINQTSMEYIDADLEAVTGEPFWETPWWGEGDEVGDDVEEWVERAAAGEYVDFEADLTRPDGQRYTLDGVFRPVTTDDGEVVSIIVSDRDVTERREYERALEERERQLTTLVDNVPGMVYRCRNEPGWPMEFASDACREITGYDPEALETGAVSYGEDIMVETDREEVWDEIQRMIDDQNLFSVTYRIETADGDRRWVRSYGRGIFDDEGTLASLEGIVADITERKRLETELEASERRYRTLAEYFPNGAVALFDDELVYTLAAGKGFDNVPIDPEQLEGCPLRTVWDDEIADQLEPTYRAALAGEDRSVEISYAGREWVSHAVPVTDDEGTVFAGLTMMQDITDRKERERELAKYETIVETIDDGIYVKDDEGRFTMVNDAYAELTGYDREELVGAHASLVVDEDTIQQSTAMQAALADGDGPDSTMEATIQTADGDLVPSEGTIATIQGGDGEDNHVGVVRDITERKERQRKLEESNERLEQFAYAASHDLQEPLRMVSSYLQLIERRYGDALDEEGEEFLAFAVDGADRMRNMIEGLLEYSRVETRGDPFEPVDLDRVVANVREDLQVKITENDAEIAVEELPCVEGDSEQLRQVFQNLLANAIEYSGDESPRVRVSASNDGRECEIAVRDEGIGIDPAETDSIFEVFQRLHTPDEHDGTGIGLALCKRIVERHGGDIWVDSEPGEGSTFYVTLPAADLE